MSTACEMMLELAAISGSKAKNQYIKDNIFDDGFRELLYYALHPRLTYGLSKNRIDETDGGKASGEFQDFGLMCYKLSKKRAVSDETAAEVRLFLDKQTELDRSVMCEILAKTLRLGVTANGVNRVVPGFFPEWNVQQAYPIEKYPIQEGTWFTLTQKLNGVRAVYRYGAMYGRSGEQFDGLDHIEADCQKLANDAYGRNIVPTANMVFDGELLYDGPDAQTMTDNERFRKSAGILNSDSLDEKKNIRFVIFDALPAVDFDAEKSDWRYVTRRHWLDAISYFCEDLSVSILQKLYSGTDQSKIEEFLDKMVAEDKEGLMVNLDVPYKCKRHRGILKVKRFYTMDLPVVRCEEGGGRLSGTLGALIVDFKGNEVGVGTGFDDQTRRELWERREDLPGTLAEIKYKEISCDKKTGAESLQFPVFVGLRTDKTEVSYG